MSELIHPKALWHLSPKSSAMLQAEQPLAPSAGEIIVKSHYSMVSMGTERLVALGQVPAELVDQMRVPYQQGALSLPVSYGYSLVGEVLSQNHPLSGQYVHLMHPHQDYCCVNAAAVTPIPSDVPLRRAVLTSNMETVLNAIWDSEVSVGDCVLVAGLGSIGALLALSLSLIPGVKVWILEKDEAKCQWAREQNLPILSDHDHPVFDISFHTTAHPAAFQCCLDALGYEGKLIELSWYGSKQLNIHLGGSFHHQRKQIICSQVSRIPTSKQARWDYKRRKEAVFGLLEHAIFDRLEMEVIAFEESVAFFEALRAGRAAGGGLGVLSYV